MFATSFLYLVISRNGISAGKDLISVLHGHTSTAGLQLEQETAVNWRQCVHHCRNHPLCASFNYRKHMTQQCSLFRNKDIYTEHTGDSSLVYSLMVGRQGASVCVSNPCQNGGQCVEDRAGYLCQCVPGFAGVLCEINIDECASNPCQNGGNCVDGLNSYNCDCATGFQGALCQTNIDDCTPNACSYQGQCVDGVNSYSCNCDMGYAGTNCQININDCVAGVCNNGKGSCTDGINSYTCSCYDGWSGTDCTQSHYIRYPGGVIGGFDMTGVEPSTSEIDCDVGCRALAGCTAYMYDDLGGCRYYSTRILPLTYDAYSMAHTTTALLGGDYPPP